MKVPDNLSLIQDLVDQIEENLGDEVNIPLLARQFDLSPWHFQRLFKSLIGDTLGGYIRGRRLTKAAQLLLDSEMGVIDVAFSTGFNSHEAFTRSFKAYFQKSPKVFRKDRPSVLLDEKPLLTMELFDHLAKGMQQQPEIKVQSAQTIIGFSVKIPSPFNSNENYCDLLYSPWKSLLAKETAFSDRTPGTYYGMTVSPSGEFVEETLDYIAGIPVEDADKRPSEMMTYTFPEQLVAMFEVFAGTEDSLAKTVDYVYGYWLPNSLYTRGNGNDYELFENVTNFEDANLMSKYVLPIVKK